MAMPRTIDEGFHDFLTKLTPSAPESDAAKSHRASVEACLKAKLGLKRFFRTGSFGNGTSISGYSDVDYFAHIPRENLKQNSGTTLRSVRDVLDERFPNTGVRVSCPAVKVPFGSLARESTEVVTADYIKDVDGRKVYEIPDCSDSWMRSSPDAHNAYVRDINDRLDGNLKPLIRFIKAWKYFRNVPISSFYLELRVAKFMEKDTVVVYDIDVQRIFAHLQRLGLASMQDPMGISGYIRPCSTDAKLEDSKSKLATAATRAEKARQAENEGDTNEAFEWWNLLYDSHFPSYYR
jgi:SMODS domain-containing protein